MKIRDLAAARSWLGIGFGGGLLTRPRQAAGLAAGAGRRPPSALVAVLGLRELAQAVALLRCPRRQMFIIGMTIDLLHGISMLLAAAVFPAYHRAAAVSAAGAFLGAGLLAPAGLHGRR